VGVAEGAEGSSSEIAGTLGRRKRDLVVSDEEDESEDNGDGGSHTETHTDTDRYSKRQRFHATPVDHRPTVQAEQTEKEKTYCAICCAFSCAHLISNLQGKEPAEEQGEGGAITVETSSPSNFSTLGLIRGFVQNLFKPTGTGQ
jgi:hypothetical protein